MIGNTTHIAELDIRSYATRTYTAWSPAENCLVEFVEIIETSDSNNMVAKYFRKVVKVKGFIGGSTFSASAWECAIYNCDTQGSKDVNGIMRGIDRSTPSFSKKSREEYWAN